MPVAALSDPHMGDAAKHPGRVERIIAAIFVLAMVFFGVAGAAYWQNWNAWTFGGALGAGMFLLGFGLTAWGKYLMPQGPFVEERHALASSPEERDSMAAALVERAAVVVKRRKLLGGLFARGPGVFGIVAALPAAALARPAAQDDLRRHGLAKGSVLVDSSGRPGHQGDPRGRRHHDGLPAQPVRYDDGQHITDDGQAVDQTVLIRLSDQPFTTDARARGLDPRRATWPTPRCAPTWAARSASTSRSSSCSCARATSRCSTCATAPCPSSARRLGRCRSCTLGYNDDGYLIAMAPYDQPVGPGFWERTTT